MGLYPPNVNVPLEAELIDPRFAAIDASERAVMDHLIVDVAW